MTMVFINEKERLKKAVKEVVEIYCKMLDQDTNNINLDLNYCIELYGCRVQIIGKTL